MSLFLMFIKDVIELNGVDTATHRRIHSARFRLGGFTIS
jgi:hypothetical protein